MKLINIDHNIIRFTFEADASERATGLLLIAFTFKDWKKQVLRLRKADDGSHADLEYSSVQQFLGPGYLDQMATGDCGLDADDIIEYIDVYL